MLVRSYFSKILRRKDIAQFESIETNLETKLRSFGGTISIG